MHTKSCTCGARWGHAVGECSRGMHSEHALRACAHGAYSEHALRGCNRGMQSGHAVGACTPGTHSEHALRERSPAIKHLINARDMWFTSASPCNETCWRAHNAKCMFRACPQVHAEPPTKENEKTQRAKERKRGQQERERESNTEAAEPRFSRGGGGGGGEIGVEEGATRHFRLARQLCQRSCNSLGTHSTNCSNALVRIP